MSVIFRALFWVAVLSQRNFRFTQTFHVFFIVLYVSVLILDFPKKKEKRTHSWKILEARAILPLAPMVESDNRTWSRGIVFKNNITIFAWCQKCFVLISYHGIRSQLIEINYKDQMKGSTAKVFLCKIYLINNSVQTEFVFLVSIFVLLLTTLTNLF